MKWVFKVAVRIVFIGMWCALGRLFGGTYASGLLSGGCAFGLMEICYYIDRKTSGIDKILTRLDFLDETLVEADKTRSLILQQLMIESNNIEDDSDFSKGVVEGIEISKQVVENRFEQVATQLHEKKSLL